MDLFFFFFFFFFFIFTLFFRNPLEMRIKYFSLFLFYGRKWYLLERKESFTKGKHYSRGGVRKFQEGGPNLNNKYIYSPSICAPACKIKENKS
jgi:hypothetical protein